MIPLDGSETLSSYSFIRNRYRNGVTMYVTFFKYIIQLFFSSGYIIADRGKNLIQMFFYIEIIL